MGDLLYEKFPKGHYAIFTMNRPDKLNAINAEMQDLLRAAIYDFKQDKELWVGILTGKGRAFSAGNDLAETADRNRKVEELETAYREGRITSEERLRQIPSALRTVGDLDGQDDYHFLSACPKPLIAAVNGLAIAAGMERAADCDVRIASTAASFGLAEVQRGIMAGYAIHHLARLIPFGEVMYLLITGDSMGAEEAHRLGFVHNVVEPAQLMPEAVALAERIGRNGPRAVQGTKAVAQFSRNYGVAESLRMGTWVRQYVMDSPDAIEGPKAFIEKRPPSWKG